MHLTRLVEDIIADPDLAQEPESTRVAVVQALFVSSGCDFVSFFAGLGKFSTYKSFFQFAKFITRGTEPGTLTATDNDGNLAFLRLTGTVYYQKHKAAFDSHGPDALFKRFASHSTQYQHEQCLSTIRDVAWECTNTEDEYLPSTSALHLHWKCSQWVLNVWDLAAATAIAYPSLQDHGWKISVMYNGQVSISNRTLPST